MSKLLYAALAACLSLLPAAANANAADPKPTALIFKDKQMELTKQGDELVYEFSTKPSDETQGGKGFSDKISLKVKSIAAEKRAIALQIYTGDRARELQEFEVSVNPVFQVVLQQVVASISRLTGGDANYLKVRFTKVLDDKSKVEALKVVINGTEHDAYRISLTPFKGDPAADRMKGYDDSTFSMIVSPTVPGELVESVSTLKSSQAGNVAFVDRTAIAGYGGVK